MSAIARTDEEEQLTIPLLQSRIQDLQNEVRELQDKTDRTNDNVEREKESNAINNQILHKDICDQKDEIKRELDEAKAELKSDVADLKQQLLNLASNTTGSSLTAAQPRNFSPSAPPSTLRAASPFFFLRNNDAIHDGLPPDTYTMMMISPLCSQAWLLGLFAFAFQIVLIGMILSNQLKQSETSSHFNVPFKVDPEVRAGQCFAIIFALATQNDIITAVRFIIMFWSDPNWDRTILGREEGAPPPTTTKWLVHIILPNIIKFVQGFIVTFITFIVIVQSDNIIDLLKDFTALMVLSDTDNIFFRLAANGYIGSKLQMKTIQAQGIKIQTEASFFNSDSNHGVNQTADSSPPFGSPIQQKDFIIRPTILFVIALAMIGVWLYIVFNQITGIYFLQRYPGCNKTLDAFELAKEHFGDGVCYGGTLNTLGCEFEDGDCVDFNQAFPLCKGDNRTDVQNRVGDGNCEKLFMSSDCDYDGGDCCPYDIINDPLFGDGQCNGGIMSTESCGHDDKDCDKFILDYPDCPLDNLSKISGADDVVIGNSICDSGIYNLEECGYEYGDCNLGQVGQDVFITDGIGLENRLWFSEDLSLEGMTVASGLYRTSEYGIFDLSESPGLVRIWRYDVIRKQWLQLGRDIVSPRDGNVGFGYGISLTSSGLRIAISSFDEVRVYDFNPILEDKWSQVGHTIHSNWSPNAVITSDGSRVALIYSKHEIHICDLPQSDQNSDIDCHIINPDVGLAQFIQLKFNALDGSKLLLNDASDVVAVFRLKSDVDSKPSWIQMGQDFLSPRNNYTESPTSTAISADGNRIAIAYNSTHDDAPGQVYVFDFDTEKNEWIPVGKPIISSLSNNGDGFGYEINMSSDGNLLVIASNTPRCQEEYRNVFDHDKCTAGSIELYNYHHRTKRFQKVPPNPASPYKNTGNILDLADLTDSGIVGVHFSMNEDGSVLSISGFNVDDGITFIEAYNLEELFYTKCVVKQPQWVGDGWCSDWQPYNSEECGFDGGDCVGAGDHKEVEYIPLCLVYQPESIGNDDCQDYPPYNSKECEYDGNDCVPKSVNDYPECSVHSTDRIGNGWCDDFPPYNTEECGFDGGDCL